MPTAAVTAFAAVAGSMSANSASKRAASAQNSATAAAQRQLTESTGQARGDLQNIFPQAQERGQQGFQGALDVFRGVLPQQAQQFQQGNVAAQNAILAGLPQMQNAILGGNVDLSQLQPFQAETPNFDFIPQNINPVGFQKQQEGQAVFDQMNADLSKQGFQIPNDILTRFRETQQGGGLNLQNTALALGGFGNGFKLNQIL